MRPTSRAPVLAVAAVLVGLLATGLYLRLRPASDEAPAPGNEGAVPVSAAVRFPVDVAIPVEGAPVRRDTLVIRVTAAGEAAAWRRAPMRAQVEGRVVRVPVRENDRVRAGDLLLVLDSTEYALAVARARSELRKAEAEFRRLTLFDEEIPDPAVREERRRLARATSGLEQAEVALREAELNLARTRVRAPFPGRVADVRVVPGEYVERGAELLTVVDLDPIKVEVGVLEGELALLEEGRRAAVRFAAFPEEVFRGRIETINPVVDPETRTGRVTVVLPNPEGRVKPGMYARVALDALRFPDRVLVPRAAILERDRRTMLFVYEGDGGRGRAKWRYVETGLENDSVVEIVPSEETEMVKPGEIVLVGGHATLGHDALVRLVERVGEGEGRPR